MKEKLKKIFNKSRLTAEDKGTLRTIAAELGVEVRSDYGMKNVGKGNNKFLNKNKA